MPVVASSAFCSSSSSPSVCPLCLVSLSLVCLNHRLSGHVRPATTCESACNHGPATRRIQGSTGGCFHCGRNMCFHMGPNPKFAVFRAGTVCAHPHAETVGSGNSRKNSRRNSRHNSRHNSRMWSRHVVGWRPGTHRLLACTQGVASGLNHRGPDCNRADQGRWQALRHTLVRA